MRKVAVFACVFAVVFALALNVQAGDIDKLKKKLSQELQAGDYTSAASTIAELGEDGSVDAVKVILTVALNENMKSAEVFSASKDALNKVTDKEAIEYLCSIAKKKSRDWRVKMLLAEVLGNLKGEGVLDALTTLLEEKQPEVVREAIESLRKLGDVEAVDELIEALARLEAEKGRPWVEARKALHELSGGYDFTTAAKWREFWTQKKEDVKKEAGSPDTAKPLLPGGDVKTGLLEEEKKSAPKFFGKEILSKKVVFVIDVSGSMIMKDRDVGGGEAGKGGAQGSSEYDKIPKDRMRIERAKSELKKAIAGLPPKAKFNVIAFSAGVSPWQKQKLVLATSQNKQAAIAFADRFNANGGTYTDDVLKEAFANKEADTIFFLSDGAPEKYPSVVGQENPDNVKMIDTILTWFRNENKFRKVKIFTFGFDGEGVWDPNRGPKPPYHQKAQRFIDFMKKLAEESGGEYQSIK